MPASTTTHAKVDSERKLSTMDRHHRPHKRGNANSRNSSARKKSASRTRTRTRRLSTSFVVQPEYEVNAAFHPASSSAVGSTTTSPFRSAISLHADPHDSLLRSSHRNSQPQPDKSRTASTISGAGVTDTTYTTHTAPKNRLSANRRRRSPLAQLRQQHQHGSGRAARASSKGSRRTHSRSRNITHPAGAAAEEEDMTANVVSRGHTCTLTYSPVKDSFRITRVTGTGKTRTVLNIPTRVVINVETAAEREARQIARQANDEAIKLVFAENGAGAGLLCLQPPDTASDAGDPFVFAHSRVNTGGSVLDYYGSGLLHRSSLLSPMSHFGYNAPLSPIASGAPSIRYFVHYVRQRNKERPTIHTLEFQSSGTAEAVQAVVTAVVRRVYHHGPKHILVFISPKSGKGKGERLFDKNVRPLLHFSRHTFQTYITKRAHDCEDYVANLENPMNGNTVVTAVGGDGMINEIVNGVHRRKLALVHWLRGVTTDVGDLEEMAAMEDNSMVLPDLLSSSSTRELHVPHDDGEEGGGRRRRSNSSSNSSSNSEHQLDVEYSSDCHDSTTRTDSNSVDPQTLATTADDASITVILTKESGTDVFAGPTNGGFAELPCMREGLEENKRGRCKSPGQTTGLEARRLARRLVEEGWDSLMPLVATVPTGSACGLAKSLDVLSVAESALALVHLSTVHLDLLNMHFTPNKDIIDYQRSRLSLKKFTAAKHGFAQYLKSHAEELKERAAEKEKVNAPAGTVCAAASTTAPFLRSGSNVYTNVVDYALKIPHFEDRVGFMSLSFGAANDIDHGSEPLRWMGNARFQVYGGYMLLMGLQRYTGVLKYLPWVSKEGKTMEKLHANEKVPDTSEFPLCTMREDCPHCQRYGFSHCAKHAQQKAQEDEAAATVNDAAGGEGDGVSTPLTAGPPASEPVAPSAHGRSAAAVLEPFTDAELLDEDSVNFDDPNQPWVTIRGEFCIALMCNVRDVAQDMLMAPLAHMSDGAIDVVYCRIDPHSGRGGRMEMLKVFMGLESGKHVNLDFVNYVKARALEIKVDAGISMSDGELMPLSSVRMTKLRRSVQLVRSE